jgi:hypothetical protein
MARGPDLSPEPATNSYVRPEPLQVRVCYPIFQLLVPDPIRDLFNIRPAGRKSRVFAIFSSGYCEGGSFLFYWVMMHDIRL